MSPNSCALARRASALVLAAVIGCGKVTPPNPPPPPPPPVTGSVAGVVSAEQTPLASVQVRLEGNGVSRSGATGADGRFRFESVPAGGYNVSVTNPDPDVYRFDQATIPVTVAAVTPDLAFRATIRRGSSILGAVTVDGVARSGIKVTVTGPEGPTENTTDSQGRYSVGSLRAGGYAIDLTNPDAAQLRFAPVSASVALGPDRAETVNFAGATVVPPSITLASTTVTFSALQGQPPPAPQTVAVTNGGGGTLGALSAAVSYPAGQPAGWLTAALSSPGAPAILTLTPATVGLNPGTFGATVAIADPAASNTPRLIAVTITIAAPPSIVLSATAVGFNAVQGGANPASQNVTVSNGGGGTLGGIAATVTYGAGQPAGWLAASASSAIAPSTVTLAATTGALPLGTYTATVSIAASAANSPQSIGVTFVVGASAQIALSSAAVSFSATQGTNPPTQQVAITNSGSGSLSGLSASVVYAAQAGWLTASLNSTTAPATVTLSVLTGALPPGSYGATVSVLSPVATNSPRTIAVTLTVTQPGSLQVAADDLGIGLGIFPLAYVPNERLPWGPRVQLRTPGGQNDARAGIVVTAGGATVASGGTAGTDAQGLALFRNLALGSQGTAAVAFSAPGYGTATGQPSMAMASRIPLVNGATTVLASNNLPGFVSLAIPANATGAMIQSGTTNGLLDFWAKTGAVPTIHDADCESVGGSGAEYCDFGGGSANPLTTGTLNITLNPMFATGSYLRATWWDCATRPALSFAVAVNNAITGTDCQAPEVSSTRDRYRLPNLAAGTTVGTIVAVNATWPWAAIIKEQNSIYWSWGAAFPASTPMLLYTGQPNLDLAEQTGGAGGSYTVTATSFVLNSATGTCAPIMAMNWGLTNLLDFTLASGDCVSNTKVASVSDRFYVRLAPGQLLEVSAQGVSSGFDPYLFCWNGHTTTSTTIRSADDNNGGGTNAYMQCDNPTASEIGVTVEVTTSPASGIHVGTYRLGLRITPATSITQ